MRNLNIILILAFISLGVGLGIAGKQIRNLRTQVVQLQLDRDEIKLHTDMLAEIVKTQQYQIDVLTEMIK